MPRSILVRSSAVAATGVLVGITSLFTGTASASAAVVPTPCGQGGTLLTGNICEQTFSADGTFTPDSTMTKLQVLLVAGGGTGLTTTGGYGPFGGGGGQVTVADFSADVTDPIDIVVGQTDQASSATQGATNASATDGGDANGIQPGESGNGNAGFGGFTTGNPGGGGGASYAPDGVATGANGGAGSTAAAAATHAGLTNSLFSTDTTCYGGGGAVTATTTAIGAATCGGGSATSDGTIVAASPGSGGGGAGSYTGVGTGASGVVVVRWAPTTVTLTFASSHGSSVAPETVVLGAAPTKPADPQVTGFVFKGWFTDPGLTTPADFTAPLSASATFYPSFVPTLATTGGGFSPWEAPTGIAALGAGLALAVIAARRRGQRA